MSWKHGSLRAAVAPLALPRPAKERPRGSSPKSPSPVEINMVHKDKDTCAVKVEVIAMGIINQKSMQIPSFTANAYKCLKHMHSRSHQKQLPKLRQHSSAYYFSRNLLYQGETYEHKPCTWCSGLLELITCHQFFPILKWPLELWRVELFVVLIYIYMYIYNICLEYL